MNIQQRTFINALWFYGTKKEFLMNENNYNDCSSGTPTPYSHKTSLSFIREKKEKMKDGDHIFQSEYINHCPILLSDTQNISCYISIHI